MNKFGRQNVRAMETISGEMIGLLRNYCGERLNQFDSWAKEMGYDKIETEGGKVKGEIAASNSTERILMFHVVAPYADIEKPWTLAVGGKEEKFNSEKFEEGFIEYWSSEDELENLHYSPVLKNCSTTKKFLIEYSKLQHVED